MKTITLRLDDLTYNLFRQFALSDNRPLSNMIETAARKHMEECLFVSDAEMNGIREDKTLVQKLKRGSQAAGRKKGSFIE